MISTVTSAVIAIITSTTTTTTTTTTSSLGLSGSLSLVAVVTLLALLIQKEIVTAAPDTRGKTLGRALNTAIVPLLIAFVLIAAAQIVAVLR